MNKILTWIRQNMDKLCHVSFSIIISVIFSIVFYRTTMNCTIPLAALCGILGTVLIGVLKEIFDFFAGERIDAKDLFTDVIGAISGSILFILFNI